MNARHSRLILVWGVVGLIPGLAFAAPVRWEQNGHSYEVISAPQGISWGAAKAAAEAKGGYLATITSAAENMFVFDLTVAAGVWFASAEWFVGPWLGGTDAASEGNWEWVTGEPWGYTSWLAGQPDNWQDEDYLMFWGLGSITPTWNDGDIASSYVIEYEPPTIEIQFDFNNTIFISKPISKSPDFQIDTLASPPGGSYKWQIVKGRDKIKFRSATEGDLADYVIVRGTEESEMLHDVEIKVTYTVNSQPAEDSIYIIVLKPSSISFHHKEPPVPNGIGGYLVKYHFQVLDQKGFPLTHNMYVTEKRKKVSPHFKGKQKDLLYNSPLLSGGDHTNWNGIFHDKIGLNYSVPNDFIAKVEVQIKVEGWDLDPSGTRCQIYHATDAESVEGPCR